MLSSTVDYSAFPSLTEKIEVTYHCMSPAHLQRYVNEFAGRHNQRPYDTEVKMRIVVHGLERKRLRYKDLAVGRRIR